MTLTALALILFAAPLHGQERGLLFVGGLGYETGGPGPSLVEDLAAAGLDDRRYQRCFGAGCEEWTDHPFYFTQGLEVAGYIGGRYRFQGPYSLETLLSNGALGHAEGYNAARKESLIIRYATFLLTTTLGAHFGPLRLEAGPVVNLTRWEVTRNRTHDAEADKFVFGAAAGVSGGLRFHDVLLALKTGVRAFPSANLEGAVNVPVSTDYQMFYLGVTVSPWVD